MNSTDCIFAYEYDIEKNRHVEMDPKRLAVIKAEARWAVKRAFARWIAVRSVHMDQPAFPSRAEEETMKNLIRELDIELETY